MNYYDIDNIEVEYLLQYYSEKELDNYAKGNHNKLHKLYLTTQPTLVKIGDLHGKVLKNETIRVSSPDGFVPVTDCIEKIKDEMYEIKFKSGKVIRASHDHLFQKPDETWHYAKDMKINDSLISSNGLDTIISTGKYTKKTKVYDLSVNHENHRYYTDTICSHNSGKSLFMQNIAVNWIEQGLSGVFLTLELSEGLTAMRIDSMISGISTRHVFKDIDDVELKVKIAGKKSGDLRIKYMPAQSNVNQIRSYLKELQIQSGIAIDFIMVDYLDLIMPVTAKVSPNDLFVKDKYVSEELRNLAKELNLIMITASQLNRGAVEEVEFDHSHIAGGLSKINTADNVFGIFTNRQMKEQGKYQIQLMKTRSSAGVGMKVDLEFDIETLRITDPGESGQRSTQPTIAASVAPRTPVGKAEVNNVELKQMLASLKSEEGQ